MPQTTDKECFSQRTVLWFLVFAGFAINYMIRVNMNIAIVSMVRIKPKVDVKSSSDCPSNKNETLETTESIPINTTVHNNGSTKELQLDNDEVTVLPFDDTVSTESTFEWNEHQQARVLGAFFWLHWVTQIPGGMLATKYGTKLIFGVANFTAVLCCFFIPTAAYLGEKYVILLRIFQGLLAGFSWPSMHNMTAKWIPPNERSKFVTAYLGSSIGVAVTFPMCGYIIHLWGWEWVFYVSGVIGCVWYTTWYFLVYDSPNEHPRISQEEKLYITKSLGETVSNGKRSIPWRHILTSRHLLVNILAQWGGIWGLYTLMTHAPTYFKVIHGWNITATGVLSGIPHIARVLWALIFSYLGDYLLRSNKMSRTNVRKLAAFFCTTIQGLCLLGLAYSGCNKIMAILLLTASTGANGAVSTGPLASLVDLSPNYASIMLGICNSICVCIGFLTPIVTAYFTYNNQTVAQWQKVYWVGAGQLIFVGLVYILFATSELQPWNSAPEKAVNEKVSEMKPLKEDEKN